MKKMEVTLPCDLPTWEAVQEYLMVLQSGDITVEEMIVAMLRIYDICNIKPGSGDGTATACVEIGELDESIFDNFREVVENSFSPRERERFMSRTLPCMARYAIALKELKPKSNPFSYQLKGYESSLGLDRRFVASLVANIFFSTMVRRPGISDDESIGIPELEASDVTFTTIFGVGSKVLQPLCLFPIRIHHHWLYPCFFFLSPGCPFPSKREGQAAVQEDIKLL